MSLTMRALRLGQLSVKSASCYAASTLPAVARYHTPYNYHSLDKPKSVWNGLVYADSTNLHDRIFHTSQLCLACLFPISFVLAPSVVSVPLDYVMSILYPLHGWIGMSHIYSDYCGPMLSKTLRVLTILFSVMGMVGLLYLTATSDGLTATIKRLWRPKMEDKRE